MSDKHIIELEAQLDMLLYLISELKAGVGRKPNKEENFIRKTYSDTNDALTSELNEKDQAAKDDRDDMKMEEERGDR